jgi:hypothetical protein
VRGTVTPNQDLQVRAEVDGKSLSINGVDPAKPASVRTDERGGASFQIKLPAAIEKGRALLEIQIPGGAGVSQPIPLAGSRLTVEFFPEGGDLVAGVSSRVYFRIRNDHGEPVDPQGHITIVAGDKTIVDADQKQALGAFTFVPDSKAKYRLRLTYPNGMTESADAFKDLVIHPGGVVLRVPEPVGPGQEPPKVVLQGSDDGQRLLLVATCRGQVVAQRHVTASRRPRQESLQLVKGTRGVVRLTVYQAGGDRLTPLAERLIYRVPAERLSLSIANAKPVYRAGDAVSWKIQVRNEQGGGEPAWLLVAVVDQKVLGPADARSLKPPAHFYLTSDVRRPEDLENADLLLLDSAEGRQALDLFLGTQGWRRFTKVAEAPAYALNKEAKNQAAIFSFENDSHANLAARAGADLKQALTELRQDMFRQRNELEEERGRGAESARLAAAGLADFENLPASYLRTGVGILIATLLLAGAVFLLVGLARILRRNLAPTNAFAGAFTAMAACLVLFATRGSLPSPDPKAQEIHIAELGKKAWPPLPEERIPVLPAPGRPAIPVGSFAMAPAATAPVAGRSDFPLTADMHARLLNRQNLPLTAAVPEPIKPLKIPLPRMTKVDPKAPPRSAHVDMPTKLRHFRYQPSANPTLADTVLWHPVLEALDGSAEISFGLPGNLTSYRILLYGNSSSGRLGVFQGQMDVRK